MKSHSLADSESSSKLATRSIALLSTVLLATAGLVTLGLVLGEYALVHAAPGDLQAEVLASYNLVVDSNVLAPSTYAPSVATVAGRVCNDSSTATLTDTQVFIGDYLNATPGVYPKRYVTDTSPTNFANQHPHLVQGISGDYYAFEHVGGRIGTADASRFIGDLGPGECRVQYWHFSYPRRSNPKNTGPEPVWGETNVVTDDLWLTFDIWSTASDAGSPIQASSSWTMTMRNEISAMANKIQPNPSGRWFNTNSNTVLPGDVITSNGILYELGNINKGFDNDGDYLYDYNAWLQPVGDPAFDPSCFRLIRTSGQLTVSRSAGQPDYVLPFDDQLYFTNLPSDNTGVVGLVYYTFMAMDGPCSTGLTPYQEVASGADNEKFNADYGTGIPPLGSSSPEVTIDKSGSPNSVSLGDSIQYQLPFLNTGAVDAGLGLSTGGTPLVISDTIPAGTQYVAGSSTADVGVIIRYSTDGGSTWNTTEPVPASDVTTIQWWLTDTLAAGSGGYASFEVTVPAAYSGSPFIENCAGTSFGGGVAFADACTVTMVDGPNQIGDYVWQDEDGDALQDAGENGLDDVTVTLYWDRNGDGVIDGGDIVISSTRTAGGGMYGFSSLPDGNFLVEVDTDDPDLPIGYANSTATYYAVALDPGGTDPNPVNYDQADFGFAPMLRLDKTLISGDPSYEGEPVIYTIDLFNTLPGNGSGVPANCSYIAWANIEDVDHTGLGPKAWMNTSNAFGSGGPDGLFASADFGQGANNVIAGAQSYLGNQGGNIISVEAVLYLYLSQSLVDDDLTLDLYYGGSLSATQTIAEATLNGYVGANNAGILAWDISGLRPWQWSDFNSPADVDLSATTIKRSSPDTGFISLDGMGFRITTDQTCGGAADTIDPLPMRDFYDADRLSYVSAVPTETSVITGGASPYANTGTIYWSNLGPLYAGGTRAVTVTFTALEPPDSDADGENDPTTITNTATVTNATFTNGKPTNIVSDVVASTLNPAGSIGDLVWNDIDGDGAYEPDGADGFPSTFDDELGIANVTLELRDGICTPGIDCQTTSTDSGGLYLFDGLRDDSYTVAVLTTTLPNGGAGSINTSDLDSDLDSDSGPITINNDNGINTDDDVLTADFGYTLPALIIGSIWNDRDQSGSTTPDLGEEGLSGIAVYADDGTCTYPGGANLCPSAITDANGDFTISGLAPAAGGTTYTVTVYTITGTLSSGTWTQSFDTDGLATLDQSGVALIPGGVGQSDYSYYETGSATIGDTLYSDWDGDGVQDNGETGIAGVAVYLYEDSSGDGNVDPATDALIATDVTDANGQYLFSNLTVGDYIVDVDESDPDLPGTYIQTGDPDEGAATCSICNGRSSVTTAASGSYLNEDFGYRPTGFSSIGDYVWQDDDGDGVQDAGEAGIANITVTLYRDINNDGMIDSNDALVMSTTTDAGGNYTFINLPAGDYLVMVDAGDADLPIDGNGDPFVLSTNNDPHDVTLGVAENYVDADFGFTTGGVIGDFIWQDNDGDGSQDASERGIPGVTVSLYVDADQNGIVSAGDTVYGTTTTNVTGTYEFTGLPSGDYVVEVGAGVPAGYNQTGDPNETPPPCTCDGESGVTLAAGQIDRSRDFGYQPSGRIGDTVWIDIDGDGVYSPTLESGIGGATMVLLQSGTPVMTTTTDSDGYYMFGNVPDGNYTVQVASTTLLAGLTQTFDPDEANPCTTCDHVGSVTLGGGIIEDLTLDFGFRYSGVYSISGTVFHDSDKDGAHDQPGEGTYANVTVYLWNGSGQLIGSTTTVGNGDYVFSGLPSGSYTVSVNENAPNLTGTSPTTPTSRSVTIINADITDQDFGFVSQVDMGDLPNAYYTLLANDGARHITGTVYLGSSQPDVEADGNVSAVALGDDLDGLSDEDGIVRTSGVKWSAVAGGGSVDVVVGGCPSGTCYLSAWIDWDNDGDFSDPGDRVLLDRGVTLGTQTINFNIPGTVTFNNTYYARFRIYENSTGGTAQSYGLAVNGEVEDYQWAFGPTAVTLYGVRAGGTASTVWAPLFLSLLVVGSAAVLFVARTRRSRVTVALGGGQRPR